MTLPEFLSLQTELFNAFGWFIRWWLILFGAAGIIAATVIALLLMARGMIDQTS